MNRGEQQPDLRIVVATGGGGSAICSGMLEAFPEGTQMDVIVPTGDSGGSSGELRDMFEIPAVGDALKASLAVSANEQVATVLGSPRLGEASTAGDIVRRNELLWDAAVASGAQAVRLEPALERAADIGRELYRRDGTLHGHPYGNIVLASLCLDMKMTDAVGEMGEWLGTGSKSARVLPSTDRAYDLVMYDAAADAMVVGEHDIDRHVVTDPTSVEMWLEPGPIAIAPQVDQAVRGADLLVFGPSSPFTSRGQLLAHEGFAAAVAAQQENGSMALVANPTRERTTPQLRLLHLVNLVEKPTGRRPEHIIYNTGRLPQGAEPLEYGQDLYHIGGNLVSADLVGEPTHRERDPNDATPRTHVHFVPRQLGRVLAEQVVNR